MAKKTDPVTREEVLQVRQALLSQGKSASYARIRAALGDRGSMSTIGRYVNEIEAEEKVSSDSPSAKEALGNLWQQARAAVLKEFEEKLAGAEERNAELLESLTAQEAKNDALEKELSASRQREQEGTDALRKALADLDVARAAQTTADAGARAADQRAHEAQSYASDVKGVLSAIAKALDEISAAANGDPLLGSLEKQIQSYLSRLESVPPGQEARAVFLQILEIDQTRREFNKARAQFEADRAEFVRENSNLQTELAAAEKSLAVAEEKRRGMDREIAGYQETVRQREQMLNDAAERTTALQAQLSQMPDKFIALENKWDRRVEELRDQLQAALVRSTQVETELVALRSKKST